ncbi:SGNH hydrolase-type esterase domain-containing protein [Phakopsora pachyrhizi]|nr:SGNH hydrolase-type esterase domain-containing protein [Phakopsora pachyrhizi]
MYEVSTATKDVETENVTRALPFFMDEFVMFGDSITQFAWQAGGTGSDLANFYQRRLFIKKSLKNLELIFSASSTAVSQRQPKKLIVTIWLGANDSVLPNRAQHVSPSDFTKNLTELISMIRNHDRSTSNSSLTRQTQIILITPPPISVEMRAIDCASRFPDWKPENMDREPGRTRQFAQLVCQVALQESLPVVDAWTSITKLAALDPEKGLSKYLIDGLHLTPAGYKVVTTELKNLITEHLPSLLPENLKNPFPWWAEIDPLDPSKSFPDYH